MKEPRLKMYMVTGTFHGSHVFAPSEGAARRAFRAKYNGESITHVRLVGIEREYLYV